MTPEALDISRAVRWAAAVGAILAVAFLAYRAAQASGFYWADDYTHLLISKQAWHHPSAVLGIWGRPLMTLAYMPAVLIGELAVRLWSLALTVATAALCWQIARAQRNLFAPIAALLLLIQPLAGTLSYSALPQTVFSFTLACALYARVKNRLVLATLIVSCLPLARLEGFVVIAVWGGWLLVKRRGRLIPLLAVVPAAWALVGAAVYHDLMWFAHSNPYGVFGSRYGAAGWHYGFEKLVVAFGPVLPVLAAAVTLNRRLEDGLTPTILLAMFAFYVGAWTLPAFNTLGDPVYLASLAVPVALSATQAASALAERTMALRFGMLAVPILIAVLSSSVTVLLVCAVLIAAVVAVRARPPRVVALGAVVALAGTAVDGLLHTSSLSLRGVPSLAAQAAKRLGPAGSRVRASTTPAFAWYTHRSSALGVSASAIERLPPGALILWDSDLGRYSYPTTRLERAGFVEQWTASNRAGSVILFRRR